MSRMLGIAAAMVMAQVALLEKGYGATQRGQMSFSLKPKVNTPTKDLKEFNIKGCKVMAYSRKDAIKRLKHNNKNI